MLVVGLLAHDGEGVATHITGHVFGLLRQLDATGQLGSAAHAVGVDAGRGLRRAVQASTDRLSEGFGEGDDTGLDDVLGGFEAGGFGGLAVQVDIVGHGCGSLFGGVSVVYRLK